MTKVKTKLTREEKKQRRRENYQKTKADIRAHKALFGVYVALRVLVVTTMILQLFNGNYDDVFLCVLTLVLFLIPSFVERRLHIDVPNTLEVIILLFIFSAEILGEIQEYYLIFPFWDTMLHTINGFLMAAIGFSLVDILNRSKKIRIRLSPAFVAVVAFCFSMTIGVLWEFFEYGMDCLFRTDMQKDTYVQMVSSVMLHLEGHNVPVVLPVDSVVVNGQNWPGYLDIGLHDTMKDLLVNFIGAVLFSLIGMCYILGRGKGKFATRFIPRLKENEIASSDAPLLEPVELAKGGQADTEDTGPASGQNHLPGDENRQTPAVRPFSADTGQPLPSDIDQHSPADNRENNRD